MSEPNNEVHIDLSADVPIHKVMENRFNTELNDMKSNFKNYSSSFSRQLWIGGTAFFILLGLSSFISYQQWQQSQQINQLINQQSQQINQLVKQLTPTSQKGSPNK